MKKIHNTLRHLILSIIDFFYKPFKKILPLQTFRYAAAGGANLIALWVKEPPATVRLELKTKPQLTFIHGPG